MFGGMAAASPVSLALSLVFGLAQLVVGIGVARWATLDRRWRKANLFVLLLLALWFACSGIAELFVSGMETLRLIVRWPPAAAFALWRGRTDAALFAATVVLLAALPVYAGASYLSRRGCGSGPRAPTPDTHERDTSDGGFPAGGD
jgi:hypothetical protein